MSKLYYVGLDVGLRKTAICVLDATGKELAAFEVISEPEVISRSLERFESESLLLGLETGQLSIYLSKGLRSLGYDAVCMDARHVANSLSCVVNKTDKNDAYGIAHLLRCNLYREVHVKSDEACDLRIILAARKQLVEQVGCLESSIRGLFKIYGVKLGPANREAFLYKIENEIGVIDELGKEGITSMVSSLMVLRKEVKKLDKSIKEYSKISDRASLLMTIPGVGPITANSFIASIDDAGRFAKSRSVGAYMGLTPRQYSSGERQRQGRVSKCWPFHIQGQCCLRQHIVYCIFTKANQSSKNGAKEKPSKRV